MGNRKKGAIIAVLLMVAGIVLYVYLGEKAEEQRTRLIQMAQNAELGEGVTLQQGVRAYFRTSADWGLLDRKNGWVFMRVNSDMFYFTAELQVNETTGQVFFGGCYMDGVVMNKDALDGLISAMIWAAKK